MRVAFPEESKMQHRQGVYPAVRFQTCSEAPVEVRRGNGVFFSLAWSTQIIYTRLYHTGPFFFPVSEDLKDWGRWRGETAHYFEHFD